MTGRTVVLLGPQREQQTVAATVDELGITGPLAVITAGWEEREHEDSELARDLGGRVRNLGLFPRAENVYVHDHDVHVLQVERDARRRRLRDLYVLRLSPQLRACRELLSQTDPRSPDEVLDPEIASAIDGIRALDHHHFGRMDALEIEIRERLEEIASPAIEHHRAELASIFDEVDALLIAGGNVATLLRVSRLFGLAELASDLPIVAWSGAAMAVSRRVVLFHDSPPQGPGDAEVYGPGLGLIDGLIPLPHARHRIELDDSGRVALLARRFAPADCITLDYGGRIDRNPDTAGWIPSRGASVLQPNGSVSRSEAVPDPPHRRPDPEWSVLRLRNEQVSERSTGTGASIVADLVAAARLGSAALDLEMAQRSFPVVGDGWAVFAYRGPAKAVTLRHWMSGFPALRPFEKVLGADLWLLETEIQEFARIEYKLEVVSERGHELIPDPLNERLARDPYGANSVVQGPGYERPIWSIEQPTARRGEIVTTNIESAALGSERQVSVYVPARFRATRRYPLLVVHDGDEYAEFASLTTVLDNLIHRLEIPPLIVALTQSPDRLAEYGASERHAEFVVDELLPELESSFPLLDGPGGRGLIGASFGAVASLHAAWSRPGTFGKLLLQSGSFAFTDVGDHDLGPMFDPVVDFVNRFRKSPGRPADKVFLSAGIYEKLVYFNRSLLPVLQQTGADVLLVESQDGHNWENWRDQLRAGLTWLFTGPLWMVYE